MNQVNKIWEFYEEQMQDKFFDRIYYIAIYSQKILYEEDWWVFKENFDFSSYYNLRREFES